MQKRIHGFTMIELVLVVAILGILAVIAIPKLFTISGDAQVAATNSVAGALSAANSENYAVRAANNNRGHPVTNCTSIGNLLESGNLPNGYSIQPQPISVGDTMTCTVTGLNKTSATFTATGIS